MWSKWFHPVRFVPLIVLALFFNDGVPAAVADAAPKPVKAQAATASDPNYARMDYTLGYGSPDSTGALRPGVNRIVWKGNGATYYDVMTIQLKPFQQIKVGRVYSFQRTRNGFRLDHRVSLGSYRQYTVKPSNAPVPGTYVYKTIVQMPASPDLSVDEESKASTETTLRWTSTLADPLCTAKECRFSLFRDGLEVYSGPATSYVAQQEANRTYTYSVVACNRGGCSDQSNSVLTWTFLTPLNGEPVDD
jgi:hypothetical protein